jgi:hypothetical protein
VRLLRPSRFRFPPSFHVRAFVPCAGLLCPRLTSACSSRRLVTAVANSKRADLPGYCAPTFSPYTRRIYFRVFRMTIGL